jgi:hypothetical protein
VEDHEEHQERDRRRIDKYFTEKEEAENRKKRKVEEVVREHREKDAPLQKEVEEVRRTVQGLSMKRHPKLAKIKRQEKALEEESQNAEQEGSRISYEISTRRNSQTGSSDEGGVQDLDG